MRFSGVSLSGRLACRIASWFAPPHKGRVILAQMSPKGYIEPSATIYHSKLRLGAHCFIGDRVLIFQRKDGGPVELGDRVYIYRDTIIETGLDGYISVGNESSIHPRCQLNANVAPIQIGSGVMIAPNCTFYSYDHGLAPDKPIRRQPLQTRGPIVIGDEAWIAAGATILAGIRIGRGAVIGAGSVVTHDVPDGAIAVGIPARVVKSRADLSP